MATATGKQIFDLGSKHVGERYRLGALVPKNDKAWRGPWDCAEFTSWAIYQAAGFLYGCTNNNGNPATADAYTGFWKRDADLIGKIITVEEAAKIKGAFILRYSGSGVIGHIVISDGRGGTVEAHSTKTGVLFNVVGGRRWDIGILPPNIDYTESKPVVVEPPVGIIYRWTTPLMRGKEIKEIQSAINKIGRVKLTADGIYGSKTFFAVREFQAFWGLNPDGEVGPETLRALKLKM